MISLSLYFLKRFTPRKTIKPLERRELHGEKVKVKVKTENEEDCGKDKKETVFIKMVAINFLNIIREARNLWEFYNWGLLERKISCRWKK